MFCCFKNSIDQQSSPSSSPLPQQCKPSVQSQRRHQQLLSCAAERNEQLAQLISDYSYYIGSPNYVFKLCNDGNHHLPREWLVILEKLPDTITNENRSGVLDQYCAKFRADKLLVCAIVNIDFDKNHRCCIINTVTNYYDAEHPMVYTVKSTVTENKFNHNIEKVCTSGIHYFKSILPAFFYGDKPRHYSDSQWWPLWNDDGSRFN